MRTNPVYLIRPYRLEHGDCGDLDMPAGPGGLDFCKSTAADHLEAFASDQRFTDRSRPHSADLIQLGPNNSERIVARFSRRLADDGQIKVVEVPFDRDGPTVRRAQD